MDNFTTSLAAIMSRAVEQAVDAVARDGLVVLRDLLEQEGFSRSEFLKDYDVFAHVSGGTIMFEIVLDFEALEPGDAEAKAALEEETQQALAEASKTYGLSLRTPRRLIGQRDARRPASDARRDARRPARDARKTSQDRLFGHEVANHAPRRVIIPKGIGAPRDAAVTSEGKLSVVFQRSVRSTENGFQMPQGKFDGIVGKFLDRLRSVIADKFTPALAEILSQEI